MNRCFIDNKTIIRYNVGMSRKSILYATVMTGILTISCGLSQTVPTVEATTTPRIDPSSTPTPTPYSTPDMWGIEATQNAWMGTLGAIETSVVSSAEDFNEDNLIANGFTPKAISSYAHLKIAESGWGDDHGDGSVMYYHHPDGREYVVIFSIPHIVDDFSAENNNPLILIRSEGLSSPGEIYLRPNQFGRSEIDISDMDNLDVVNKLGVLIVPRWVFDKAQKENPMFDENRALQLSDLDFSKPKENDSVEIICSPGNSNHQPIAVTNGKIFQQFGNPRVVIDSAYTGHGCSGAGIWVNKRWGGPLSGGFEFDNSTIGYADKTTFIPLSDLGEEGLFKKIESAILDYENRQQ